MSVDMAVKVLDESLGKVVLIKLKGGKVIRGSLHGFDQHMNLLLEDSVELLEESGKQCAKCGFPDPHFRKYSWIKRRVL